MSRFLRVAPWALLIACAGTNTWRSVDVEQLSADLGAGEVPVLIDVRTPEEYASGHVPGALNIPDTQLASRLDELAPYRRDDVYLICRSGRRSETAAATLASEGFQAVNVTGGTLAWIEAGHPVEP